MTRRWLIALIAYVTALALPTNSAYAQAVSRATIDRVQQSAVKIYGAGGLQGLEAYQSGFFATEEGHVVTVDSLVLEEGEVVVVSSSGKRHIGKVLGADPLLRLAVLKVEPANGPTPAVDLSSPSQTKPGATVLAFSNMFNIATGGESCSVMRTTLAAIVPRQTVFGLSAPRGADRVLLVDSVTSNPGAAGGLLTDLRGKPIGVVGVERKGRVTGGWLNYAIPVDQVASSLRRIVQGEQILSKSSVEAEEVDTLRTWGFVMVESIAARTPPYVEYVRPNTPAAQAGVQPDDLLVMVHGLVTATASEVQRVLNARSKSPKLTLTLQRDGKLIDITLAPKPRQPKRAEVAQ